MRENGTKTSGMARGLKGIKMEILTLEGFIRGKRILKGSTSGRMAVFMMGSGIMGSSTGTVFGREFIMTRILESGRRRSVMASGCTLGPTETSMKGSGRTRSSMELVLIHMLMETLTRGSLKMENSMEKEL